MIAGRLGASTVDDVRSTLGVTLVVVCGSFVFVTSACATHVLQRDVDRCNIGTADGNASYRPSRGVACTMVAQGLVEDGHLLEAMPFARRACEVGEARGCVEYLSDAANFHGVPREEIEAARTVGESACAGGPVMPSGSELAGAICEKLGELYLRVEPRSPDDAGRAYARSCTLGDRPACGKARSLGVDPDALSAKAAPKPTASAKPPAPPPMPVPLPGPPTPPPPPPPPPPTTTKPVPTFACHDMRSCVSLDVKRRNVTELVGTLENKCDREVRCGWCPASGGVVNTAGKCNATTLKPGETKTGQAAGLWYDAAGDGLALDCIDASDDARCRSL